VDVHVKALKPPAGVVLLKLTAADERDAVAQARAQGYTVLSTRRAGSRDGVLAWLRSRFPLVLFSQELLALLNAGLNLVEALETLEAKERRPEHKSVLTRMLARLNEGKSLSAAMAEQTAVFPPLYVATVRASERTGSVPEALSRYVAYQNQLDAVKKKLVNASIYPVMLLTVGMLVTLFLLGYVVPKFSAIYDDLGGSLPWMSRLLLQWGQLIEAHGALTVAGLVALIAGAAYALSRPDVRSRIGHALWRAPAIGERLRVYQLARFYRTVGMLLKGGTPVVTALGMVGGMLQPGLRASLERACAAVREGLPLSVAMERHGLTTPVAERLLKVGERTGAMGEMMERVGEFHDEEMARWVEWFTRLFEPLLMAAIGLVIGFIVWLMYMPIFELAGSIQ
jgi:general secretion pathway protein F